MMEAQKFKESLHNCSHLSVIFQLTDKCVLSCKYCFARGAHLGVNPKVSYELLEKVITQSFLTHHPNVTFEWTGGEAFLMDIDFYKNVVSLQKQHATKPYSNSVQTSGYIFNKELIDFLLMHDFDISLTIDGTRQIHNANRPTQKGEGSFDQIIKTWEYLKNCKDDCGFISTITKNNLGYEKEMLEFFRKLGIYTFHSNPYIFFDKNIVKDKSIALNNHDYAKYFISQFNAWYESGHLEPIPYTVNYFMSGLSSKQSSSHTLCTFGGRCLTNFIAITPNGDCYNCPKFTGHTNMLLGNINEMSIPQILSIETNHKMKELFEQRLEAMHKCKESGCKYAYLCNGGCPYLSYIASNGENISEKDCMCKGKTLLLEYLESVKDMIVKPHYKTLE